MDPYLCGHLHQACLILREVHAALVAAAAGGLGEECCDALDGVVTGPGRSRASAKASSHALYGLESMDSMSIP